ncbi:trigger factor [Candidatus Falkowbacteria bacterium]|nr:trigger factor [Candidatus Falkowbacteria bacterium]
MQYKYDVKKLPKSQLEIKVTIPANELEPFLNKAIENLSSQTKIDGFRPGKVPLEMLKKKVGEMKIYEEAAVLAVEKSYIEIAQKEKFEPLGSPKVDFEKLAPQNDFIYKATVDLMPAIKIGDLKSIKIKEKEINISAQDIEKVIEDLRKMRATEALESKKAEKGDKVEVDFDILRNNVSIDGGAQKKYPLIIGEGQFIPGFEDNLIGLEAGSDKEFELIFPEKYHNKNLAGKPAKFKVKMLAVYKRTLPELNDEFAKTLGAPTIAELKKQIEHNLEHEEHHKEEERVETELLNKLIDKSQVGEIPDTLINSEAAKMVQELQSNVAMQGLKFEDYLKHLNKTPDQLKLDFAPQAIKRIKAALITRTIFFNEKMEISEADTDKEIEAMSHYYQNNPDIIKSLKTPEYRDYIKNVIGNRKVMEYLKTLCVERPEKNSKIEHNH